jgi:hypothetical protein
VHATGAVNPSFWTHSSVNTPQMAENITIIILSQRSCHVKVKISSQCTLSTMSWRCMGNLCIDPRILNLGTRWWRVASFKPWPLYVRYPLDRSLVGPQKPSGHCIEQKNLLRLQEIETRLLGYQALSLVAILTGLSGSGVAMLLADFSSKKVVCWWDIWGFQSRTSRTQARQVTIWVN